MEWRRHGSNADCGARMAGIRAVAPPAAFAAMADLARRVLPPADWSRLERSLAVAA